MGLALLIIMIGVPIAEIAVFIEAGDAIGFWPTIGVIILTAIIGSFFLRYQGLGVISRVFQSLQNNEMPVKEMFEGLCLIFAGALLLTPGFITDSVGFLLLVPPLRQGMAEFILLYLVRSGRVHGTTAGFHSPNSGQPGHPGQPGGPIIDGEFDEINPENQQIPPNNKPDQQ
ncbi:MAG: FxsA family protein [Rhodospirillales bacterium]|jgi:UPF0716 protein FxsA|nr:FxsA family protein [Rhodospirillales bacterium]